MRQQDALALTRDQHRIMADYLSTTLGRTFNNELREKLSSLRSSDLIAAMAVANMVRSSNQLENPVVTMLLHDDISTLRLLANNERLVNVERTITLYQLVMLVQGLKKAGVIAKDATSHSSLRKHAMVSASVTIGGVKYEDNQQLMVFIEENLDQFDAVFSYMEENGAYDAGLLRSHFYNEATALHEGTL